MREGLTSRQGLEEIAARMQVHSYFESLSNQISPRIESFAEDAHVG